MPSASGPALTVGTYHYVSSIGGQPTGTSTIIITRTATSTQIREQDSATIAGQQATASATLGLGSDLAPLTYTASYQGAGQSAATTANVTGATASLTGPAGPQTVALLAPATHFVVIDGALLTGFLALPAQMQTWNNAPVLALAPIYGRSIALSTDASTATKRPANLPAADVNVSLGGPYPFTIWYDPATFVTDEIDVPSQSIVVTRAR